MVVQCMQVLCMVVLCMILLCMVVLCMVLYMHCRLMHCRPVHGTPIYGSPMHCRPIWTVVLGMVAPIKHGSLVHGSPMHCRPMHGSPIESKHEYEVHLLTFPSWFSINKSVVGLQICLLLYTEKNGINWLTARFESYISN